MANNQNVVDELVVKLELDASEYKKSDRQVDGLVDRTETKAKQIDAKRKKRDTDQIKRNKETLKSVKELAAGLRNMALTVATMLGVGGGAAGLIGAVIALAGLETNLRRAAVSTGMSNREMQAWGATARRLGADASSGAQAIADLAREQKQFALTGNAPTMQAFARLGVRVGPDSNIGDVLGDAQKMYRQATPGQRNQMEAQLSAQGVSPDLIVMIKSEKDAREAFTKSLNESSDENRKALDAVSDALSAVNNAAIGLANSIATVVQPYVEQFAAWVSQAAQGLSTFVTAVQGAGGGVKGFMAVLDKESPQLANLLHDLASGLTIMGQAVDIVAYGFQSLYQGVQQLFAWIDEKLGALTGGSGHALRDAVGTVGAAIKWAWGNLSDEARRNGPDPVGGMLGDHGGAQLTPGAAARTNVFAPGSAGGSATDMMNYLIAKYGYSIPQAAAVVANAKGESTLNPAAVSPDGGALGLMQWRGPRIAAFRKKFGINPNQATWQQQMDFLAKDPYEKDLLNRSFAQAGPLGQSVSRMFEAHGNVAEDVRRGRVADQLAASFGGNSTANSQSINIQTVNVQANRPQDFVGGITRIAGPTNYAAGVR